MGVAIIVDARRDALVVETEWSRRVAAESLEAVYINGKTYADTAHAIATWAPKVRAGGKIVGYHHNENFPGVVQAVSESFTRYDDERTVMDDADSEWRWRYEKRAMPFRVAVTTARRTGAGYLASTLAGIRRGSAIVSLLGPTRVCISGDAEETERTKAEANAPECVFEAAAPKAWSIVAEQGPHHRCCANTWQAVSGCGEGADVLLVQDDVEFCDAWPLHLRHRLKLARERYGERFVLSLYSHYALDGQEPVGRLPGHLFYGNQAVYFPASVAAEYAKVLWERGVEPHLHPDDMVLSQYATATDLPILVALPNLAQHVGRTTTGLGHFHESPTYRRSQ